MDINTTLRTLVKKHKVAVGFETTKKEIIKNKIKIAIVSSNIPTKKLEIIKSKSVPIFYYKGNNSELGIACGKPFPVSTIGVIEAPDKILKLLK